MLALFLVVVVAVVLLRAGLGLLALLFKLMFGLLAVFFGGVVALSAIGFAFLAVGIAAVGVLMLVVLALAPVWIPLALLSWVVWMLLRPNTRVAQAY